LLVGTELFAEGVCCTAGRPAPVSSSRWY